MLPEEDNIPGTQPLRLCDDKSVEIELRDYVSTGTDVNSMDGLRETPPLPAKTVLPPRANAEPTQIPSPVKTQMQVPKLKDHPICQIVLRVCELLEKQPHTLNSIDTAILRGDISVLEEITKIAKKNLDQSSEKPGSSGGMRKKSK